MKLLTLNTHSLQERNGQKKLDQFVEAVRTIYPDLIALQEVNQTMSAPPAGPLQMGGYVPAPGHSIPVAEDNYAMQAALRLLGAGISCSWTWLPVKRGYGTYDEGLALFSLGAPITDIDILKLSRSSDYENWRTRKALGIRVEDRSDWFYTAHMGWWGDQEEPFAEQWKRLEKQLAGKKQAGPLWLMGDFNAPAHVRGEGYDLIQSSGWQDTYRLAAERDSGITVEGEIDGWRDKLGGEVPEGMRIDYIWCGHRPKVVQSQVVFNGKNYPVVSDHYGILIETEGAPL